MCMIKAEKQLFLEQKSEELYKQFVDDESICGLTSLFKLNGIGSKTGGRIRKLLYERYGKENVDSISFHRTAKKGNAARNLVYKHHSEETKKKMKVSIKKSWENDEERKEQNRQLMVKYCLPNSQLKETIQKRKESRSWYKRHSAETLKKMSDSQRGRPLTEEHKSKLRKPKSVKRTNYGHTEETKLKLSNLTKQQWSDGVHKRTFKSKGQKEVIDLITQLGYQIEDEYLVCGRPFDVFVKDKNLLIEFNGTFWHRDPRFYDETEGKVYWDKDREKIDNAVKSGYDVRTIWQYDWEKCNDKKQLIGEILNGTIKQ